jgi:O-antigen ligase
MIHTYFPMGSGLGGFDTLFRMHEPFSLLKLTYFNHAHNDYLEIALDAGLPGVLLLTVAISWWIFATFRVWRGKLGNSDHLAKLGSILIFLTLISSVFDYPARTPIIMAMLAIAAIWLGQPAPSERQSALPPDGQTL